MCLLGCEFIIVAFRSAKKCVLRRIGYGNPTRERGIAVGSSLTRRVTIAWHERPDRESMGETPISLSNTQYHRPLMRQAGERGIAVGSSLTRRVTIAWHERPARESMGETPMPLSK
jgi:hypothetical protein